MKKINWLYVTILTILIVLVLGIVPMFDYFFDTPVSKKLNDLANENVEATFAIFGAEDTTQFTRTEVMKMTSALNESFRINRLNYVSKVAYVAILSSIMFIIAGVILFRKNKERINMAVISMASGSLLVIIHALGFIGELFLLNIL